MEELLVILLGIITSPIILVFITAYITYLVDRNKDKKKEDEKLQLRKINLADSLNIHVEKMLVVFENLRNDAENNVFLIKNLDSARPSIYKMQELANDIVLFEDTELRNNVLKTIDATSTVIEEISSIEKFILSEEDKFKQKESDALTELRQLKIQLLKMDIKLNNESKAEWLETASSKKADKLATVEDLYSTLNAIYVASKDDLDRTRTWCKERRTFLAIRISSVQNELKDLNESLKSIRDELIKAK